MIVGFDAAVDGEQGFLQQVFGNTAVEAQAIEVGEKRAAQLLEQCGCGFRVAFPEIYNQLFFDFEHKLKSNMPENRKRIDRNFIFFR